MDPQTIEITIKAYLTEMRARLEKRRASPRRPRPAPCPATPRRASRSRSTSRRSLYEVNTFLNAASMINRLEQDLIVSFDLDCPPRQRLRASAGCRW